MTIKVKKPLFDEDKLYKVLSIMKFRKDPGILINFIDGEAVFNNTKEVMKMYDGFFISSTYFDEFNSFDEIVKNLKIKIKEFRWKKIN